MTAPILSAAARSVRRFATAWPWPVSVRSRVHIALAALVSSLFAVNVSRFWFHGDDGYIIFRFAQNLVEGNGIVYNVGERVEGYTEFVWVLLMAAGMLLGIVPEISSLVLNIAAGAGILAVLALYSRRVDPSMGAWIWVAPLCLACNRTFAAWSTGGLGTQLFAFLGLVAMLRYHHERSSRGAPWGSAALLSLTMLARPDGALFVGICGLFFASEVLLERRRPFRSLVQWASLILLVVGTHFLWRYSYYGFWLPNTFYAKVSGLWWEQAERYLTLFANAHFLPFVLPLLLVIPFSRTRTALHGLFAALIAIHFGYIAYIGGDRFEFRFMTPILPALYWLLQEGLRGLAQPLAGIIGRGHVALGCGLSVLLVGTAGWSSFEPFKRAPGIVGVETLRTFARRSANEGRFLRGLVEAGYLAGDELIAVRGAGALPYHARLPTLDLHGLNDVEIAHSVLETRGAHGHEKWGTEDYVRERGVVVCCVWNQIVHNEFPSEYFSPGKDNQIMPFVPKPVRCVKARGKYLVFGTTLSEADFRKKFARFEIVR